MSVGFGSGEGYSPADPPFAQLGPTSGGWRDALKAGAAGAFNAIAPAEMKSAVAGVGEMKAYQRRRDMARRKQHGSMAEAAREEVRNEAKMRLEEYGGKD